MSASALFSNPEPVFPQKVSVKTVASSLVSATITSATNGADVLTNAVGFFEIPDTSSKIRITTSVVYIRTGGTSAILGFADGIVNSDGSVQQDGELFSKSAPIFFMSPVSSQSGTLTSTATFVDVINVANRNVQYRPQLFCKVISGDPSITGGLEVLVSIESIV